MTPMSTSQLALLPHSPALPCLAVKQDHETHPFWWVMAVDVSWLFLLLFLGHWSPMFSKYENFLYQLHKSTTKSKIHQPNWGLICARIHVCRASLLKFHVSFLFFFCDHRVISSSMTNATFLVTSWLFCSEALAILSLHFLICEVEIIVLRAKPSWLFPCPCLLAHLNSKKFLFCQSVDLIFQQRQAN